MFKKLKEYINKRKQKKIDYWVKLDLEREEKIEKIKKSRSDSFLKDSKSLVFQALFFLIIFLIIPLYMFVISKVDFKNIHEASSAYAEEINISNVAYEDVINDSTAIVNFNQQVVDTYTHGTFSHNQAINFANNIIVGHHIYIKFNVTAIGSDSIGLYFGNTSGNYSQLVGIIPANTPLIIDTIIVANYSYLNTYMNSDCTWTIMAIDLDTMFGSDNLPSLEQAQELFVADYYAYNSGSAVSMSGLNSYTQGFNDAVNSQEYILSSDILSTNTFLNEGTKLYSDNPSWLGVDMYLSTGSFGFRFPSSLVKGDTIIISMRSFTFITPGELAVGTIPPFYVGYYNNGAFVSLGSFDLSIYNLNFYNDGYYEHFYNCDNDLVITMPSDIDTIYFRFSYTNATAFNVFNLKLTANSMNYALAIQNAYNSGYEKGSNAYKVGNNGYNQIYEAGRLQGVEDAGNYTFLSLLTTAIDVPINSVLHMFDFDLLGMNMKSFYLSMFTFAIIVFVIKLLI